MTAKVPLQVGLWTFLALPLAACGGDGAARAADGPRRQADAGIRRADARMTGDAGPRTQDGPSRSDGARADGGVLADATPRDAAGPDAGVGRLATGTVMLGPNGVSDGFQFMVPAGTRSVSIVVEGAEDRLYALAALRFGDGTDRVGIDATASYAATMEESYNVLQTGGMPGSLYQSIRLGTFTHVYPYAPGQSVPAGPAELRVVSNATSGPVRVTVVMPPEDGARVLHLDVLAVSRDLTLASPPGFLAPLQAIYDQAGIQVVVDSVVEIRDSPFVRITESTEPQEAPASQSAQLARLATERAPGPGLNVMIVDALPAGIGGLSLGTPGPPTGGYYHGVIALRASDAALARVLAHEIAHFLALQHVTNRDTRGQVIEDPIEDTRPGQGNLMENGTTLTPGQVFALTRSALLEPR